MTTIRPEIADAQSALRRVALRSLVSHVGAGISRAFFDEPSGIPVLRSNNVKDGNVVLDDLKYWHRIDPNGANLAKVKPYVGDLLINFVNGSQRELGKAAVFRGELPDCIVSTNFFIVRVNQHEVLPDYLNYFLQSQEYRRWLFRTCGFSGQGSFNQEQLRSLTVPVSPISHQKRVVSALRSLDAMRYSLGQLIDAKRIFKRGLMQQLLTGLKRFPEFRDIPWVHRPLGDFFKEKTVINKAKTVGLVYSCTKNLGIVPQAERFGKRLASADLGRYKVVEPGDLVYDPMLLWDGSIGFVPSTGIGVVSPAYETFSVTLEGNQHYFWPLLKSYSLVERYKQISQGTNVRRRKAHPKDFLKTVVPMPPTKAEQDRIAEVLTEAQREIDLLVALRVQIDLEKRGLLSRLLFGEIPVPA